MIESAVLQRQVDGADTTSVDRVESAPESTPLQAPASNRAMTLALDGAPATLDATDGRSPGTVGSNRSMIAAASAGDPSANVLQLLTKVSRPDDPLERQAAQVARQFTSHPSTRTQAPTPTDVTHGEMSMRVESAAGPQPSGTDVVPGPTQALIDSPPPGIPIPDDMRQSLEAHLGADLSATQVHTGPDVADAVAGMGARAFTHGSHIYLGPGESPHDPTLMAHEATHVIQQGAATGSQPPEVGATGVNLLQRLFEPSSQPAPRSPEQDPAFQRVVGRADGVAKNEKTHQPGEAAASAAQRGAPAPAGDVQSQAAARQVTSIEAEQPPSFDKEAFKAAIRAKIAEASPKNPAEARDLSSSGKLEQVKSSMSKQVSDTKDATQGGLKQKTESAPDTSGLSPKPVVPLVVESPGPPPPDIGADAAAPKPRSEAEIDTPFATANQSLDDKMVDAEITEAQLQKSNEPEFTGALDQKRAAQDAGAAAPQGYRTTESGVVGDGESAAQAASAQHTQAMHDERTSGLESVATAQQNTMTADEQKRADVVAKIESIYQKTKTAVEKRLERLDTDVNAAFDSGIQAATAAFDRDFEARLDDRYSGLEGAALWVDDKLLTIGLPAAIQGYLDDGKRQFLAAMDVLIDRVATMVETGLREAKEIVAAGRAEIATYVEGLDPSLRQVGAEAATRMESRFDALESSINDKQNQLVSTLAQKYNDGVAALDSRIEELQTEHQSLVSGALDAMGKVITAILELKNLLMGVLSGAADAIGSIIADPIGFLGNLVAAGMQGLNNFVSGIVGYIKNGLMEWLFGVVAKAGIQLPQTFDLMGIVSLIAQVLGLTWNAVRTIAVTLVGEPIVAALERFAEPIVRFINEGISGVWNWIKEQLSSLWDMVMGAIEDWAITNIVKAGITWIVSLLNPAGAFIKACKMIYDIVMFFVTRGSQIISLVQAITGSISAIASGNIGAAAAKVTESLAKAVPVALGFLAGLLGLGGIGETIKGLLLKAQAPIREAIVWVINKAVDLIKAAGKLLGFGTEDEPPATQDEVGGVSADALTAVAARSAGVGSGEALDGIANDVYSEYDDAGLDVLKVAISPDLSTITYSAAASPIETRSVAFATVFPNINRGIEQLRQLLAREVNHPVTGLSGSVVAGVSVNGTLIGSRVNIPSQDPADHTTHAEQLLLGAGLFDEAIQRARLIAQKGEAAQLTVSVSTATCRDCAARMTDALNSRKAALGPDLDRVSFQLAFARLYEPGNTKTGWEQFRTEATRYSDLVSLAEAGWDVMLLEMDPDWMTGGRRVLAEACAKIAATLADKGARVSTSP